MRQLDAAAADNQRRAAASTESSAAALQHAFIAQQALKQVQQRGPRSQMQHPQHFQQQQQPHPAQQQQSQQGLGLGPQPVRGGAGEGRTHNGGLPPMALHSAPSSPARSVLDGAPIANGVAHFRSRSAAMGGHQHAQMLLQVRCFSQTARPSGLPSGPLLNGIDRLSGTPVTPSSLASSMLLQAV